MRTLLLTTLALTLVTACRKSEDLDADGFDSTVDCDDSDAAIFPGADELCDELDNDCDGEVDEDDAVDATTWYLDRDADGYGDDWETASACAMPEGYAADAGDCDDQDADYHPDATEDDCTDPKDYNCDGSVGYADADEDGWPACEDCNDAAPAINPAALEICDELDNDCDGTVDGASALDAEPFFADADGDGFGDPQAWVDDCEAPEGHVADDSDCDDTTASTFPGADETCNEVDDDCDGEVDEDAVDASTWYLDADSDGYGGSSLTTQACEQPDSYVDNADDCDDLDASAWPGGTEVCDGADNDCDGSIDEDATDATTTYADSDGDGYGDADTSSTGCTVPRGYVSDATDCDDDDASAHPGGTEVCDEADNDCDGTTDEDDAVDASTWYADADADGYGDAGTTHDACDAPSGYVADDSDCDDDDADVSPGATETCNEVDDDCDGTVDEDDASDASTWYADFDGDGYGNPRFTDVSCEAASGYVADSTDCDDFDDSAYPGADEYCDGADNDCDGTVDEDDALDVLIWYMDDDGDGYGTTSGTDVDCDQPSGYAATDDDCDDSDAAVSPGATEACDGVDNDCDGYADEDPDLLGTHEDCPAESCLQVVDSHSTAPSDGVFWLEDAAGSYEATCDMSTDGGGWTLVDTTLLYDRDWVGFAMITAPTSGSYGYDVGWLSSASFWLQPGATSCYTMALRATATLPFTFTEWEGEWSAFATTSVSHQDDYYSSHSWGQVTTDCYGHVKFGTDSDDSKVGGEWGFDWNYAAYGYSPRTWSWTAESVTETDVIRWEIVDQSSDEDVEFYDIAIWVR